MAGLKAGLRKGQGKALLLLATVRLGAGFSRQELTWKQLDCKVPFISTVLYSQSERDTHETINLPFVYSHFPWIFVHFLNVLELMKTLLHDKLCET